MAKEITFSCYISIDGADPVPVESLTAEQIERCQTVMSERLSKNLSEYYANHMDEYVKLDL